MLICATPNDEQPKQKKGIRFCLSFQQAKSNPIKPQHVVLTKVKLEIQPQRELNLAVCAKPNCALNRAIENAEGSSRRSREGLPRLQLIRARSKHVR